MCGVLTPFPHTFSWCGGEFSKRYVFTAWGVVKNRNNFTDLLSLTYRKYHGYKIKF